MIPKIEERSQAIVFRQQGLSYSEIRERIPVAKSTLSLWFKEVGLSRPQQQRLTEKKRLAGLRGAQRRHEQRVIIRDEIVHRSAKEIGHLSQRELWLLGVALYWAEGHKEKEKRSAALQFGNSDPLMITLFLRWLRVVFHITDDRIRLGLYIHKNSKNTVERAKDFWKGITGLPVIHFVYFKQGNPKTKRKNIGDLYFGLLRITVLSSINLNRQIEGWIKGINDHYTQ
ncbi:hypothetical protein HZA86_03935 [Candidatus Uhrbacteria bacterium]|nr:hypothetical protein [Candidatus Uhrbacteria bacterium]